LKEEGIKLENVLGECIEIGGICFTKNGSSVGISNAIEQQLQMHNGVHVSSPQPLECWSWSEIC